MKKIYPFLLIIAFVFVCLFGPLILAFNKTGRSTKVLENDYSIKNKKQIVAKLETDFPLPDSLTLVFKNREFKLNLASISAQLDKNQLVSNLLFRRLNKGLGNYLIAFFSPKTFPLVYKYNQQQFDDQIALIANQIEKPFIPTELILSKSRMIEVKKGEYGLIVDKAKLKKNIDYLLSYHQINSLIDIPVASIGALPKDDEIANTVTKAKNLINKKLELKNPRSPIIIDDNTLISWLNFDISCKREKVNEYTLNLTQNFKQDPIDAIFKFENNRVVDFQPSVDGFTVDNKSLSEILCRNFIILIDSKDPVLTLDLPLIVTSPKIATGNVNDLGIKELLGRGVSTFKHSSEIRNHNVALGASIMNRILVAPGETFSFIKNLGEVSLDVGYKKAYIIRQGKTELDVGGGICQVSTTLFRAILNSGLNITHRQAHAYRVSYYEEDMPPGYDATVFIPKPDLSFVNDTGHHLLIQSNYDSVNKKLTYEIYGTSDGRKAEITNYRKWGAAPPPPDVYIDDPTLPLGKIVQTEQRIPGLKTAFDWTVTRGEQILHQQTFSSSYVPWAAVFRRGTATQ